MDRSLNRSSDRSLDVQSLYHRSSRIFQYCSKVLGLKHAAAVSTGMSSGAIEYCRLACPMVLSAAGTDVANVLLLQEILIWQARAAEHARHTL
jgi:hypothetical protein